MLGDRVKEMRERKAWSQGHLADAAELNIRTVQRIEAGEPCSYETLLSLAAALGVDVSQLEPENRNGDDKKPFSLLRAAVAAIAILPAAVFVTVNLLRSAMGLAGPYEMLASAGRQFMGFDTFNAVSPFVFLGGAAVALAICLPAVVHIRARTDGGTITVSGIQVRTQRLPLLLAATALLSAATLMIYAAVEQFRSAMP
jgi:transcriptional regulator with XRE-family HTH domain